MSVLPFPDGWAPETLPFLVPSSTLTALVCDIPSTAVGGLWQGSSTRFLQAWTSAQPPWQLREGSFSCQSWQCLLLLPLCSSQSLEVVLTCSSFLFISLLLSCFSGILPMILMAWWLLFAPVWNYFVIFLEVFWCLRWRCRVDSGWVHGLDLVLSFSGLCLLCEKSCLESG